MEPQGQHQDALSQPLHAPVTQQTPTIQQNLQSPPPQQPIHTSQPPQQPLNPPPSQQNLNQPHNQQPLHLPHVTQQPYETTQMPPPMKQRLQDLVNEVDPDEQLDEDVEEVLLDIADEFIENVVSSACEIAKLRKSTSLEVDDVKLYLERKYRIWIPGFGESKPTPRRFTSEAHRQRMALINKQDNRPGDDASKSSKTR